MKNQKGITLISLIITIVVLIILAGVAISMTLGENGIFNKAQEAKKMQTIATAKEQIGAEILSAQVEAIERSEELEQAQIEDIISKYGELQEDGDTIILKDNGHEVSLLDIYNGTTTTTGSYTENKAKIALLESQVELLERQKADLQAQLEDLSSSEGDQAQKIVELTEQIQALEQEKNTAEQNLITANAKVEEYENLKETLAKITVTEDNMLKDYKAYKDGQLITGTMENYAGETQDATATSDDTYTYLSIPNNGYYTTESKLRMENSNNSVDSGNFTTTIGSWYTVELGYRPDFVQIITNDWVASIEYLSTHSTAKYRICSTGSLETVDLGTQPSYGYYNFKITDTGFMYYRNYSSALTCNWVAGKFN